MVLSCVVALTASHEVFAQSLQIQPLLYNETFAPGEVKKGFVNVSNAGGSTVTLVTEVQGFKQIDDQGNLQFFDSLQMKQAVTPDLTEFQLQPHEALRLFFTVDSKKLPGGDNFGALFVHTKAVTTEGIAASVRVGTLLVLQNGQPGPRNANIESLSAAPVQWGKAVQLTTKVKNTADPAKATAFFPSVTAKLWPFGGYVTINEPPASPLIFAGITRPVKITMPNNLIGIYRLDVTAGQNTQSQWMLVVTGWWRWVVIVLLIVLSVLAAAIAWGLFRRTPKAPRHS